MGISFNLDVVSELAQGFHSLNDFRFVNCFSLTLSLFLFSRWVFWTSKKMQLKEQENKFVYGTTATYKKHCFCSSSG